MDKHRNTEERWIREIAYYNETDPEVFYIICCLYAQAKAFINAEYIQIDLSFKQVAGSTNIFSIVGWNTDLLGM